MAKEKLVALENDLMFASVMQNKDACIGLLETIFEGYKVKDVKYIDPPEVQKTIVFNPSQKSIRLDVYFQDKDTVYDIEIQRTNKHDLSKRARMYSSMMDANMLDKGLDYRKLKTSFVIFICTFDFFNKNKALYFFENLCRDEPTLPLGDERYTIFLNTTSSSKSSNKDMEAFFKYLNGGTSTIGKGKDSNSAFVKMIDSYVVNINGNEDWRQGYMKYELNLIEQYKDGRKEGFSEGLSQGKAQGRSEEKQQIVKEMMRDGVPREKIAQYTSISVEQVKSILQS